MSTNKKTETGTPLASRRAFFRGTAAGAAIGLLGMMAGYSHSSLRDKHFPRAQTARKDIGLVRGVKVTNISETSWFENGTLMGDIRGAGGLLVNQYTYNWAPFSTKGGKLASGSYEDGIRPIKSLIPGNLEKAWDYQMENAVHPENAGGFAALVEIETMEGETKRILLDSGWSYDWMDKAFQREGIDRMLANHEIDMLVLSHEHFDHFWGLPVTYKYDPTIETHIPEGFYKEGLQYIADSGHRGKLVTHAAGLHQIMPGVASYTFPVPIICRVYGEQSLYVNVAGAGLVSITGCCHQGIIQFAETALKEVAFEKFHGLYGGLHISPFDDWDPKYDDLVYALKEYGFEKVGCNHCTGEVTARKFVAAGYPVVRGSARNGSKTDVYLGNGDTIEFRAA